MMNYLAMYGIYIRFMSTVKRQQPYCIIVRQSLREFVTSVGKVPHRVVCVVGREPDVIILEDPYTIEGFKHFHGHN